MTSNHIFTIAHLPKGTCTGQISSTDTAKDVSCQWRWQIFIQMGRVGPHTQSSHFLAAINNSLADFLPAADKYSKVLQVFQPCTFIRGPPTCCEDGCGKIPGRAFVYSLGSPFLLPSPRLPWSRAGLQLSWLIMPPSFLMTSKLDGCGIRHFLDYVNNWKQGLSHSVDVSLYTGRRRPVGEHFKYKLINMREPLAVRSCNDNKRIKTQVNSKNKLHNCTYPCSLYLEFYV